MPDLAWPRPRRRAWQRFIGGVLAPLLEAVPRLRVVMEHITTRDAVDFVKAGTQPNPTQPNPTLRVRSHTIPLTRSAPLRLYHIRFGAGLLLTAARPALRAQR